ncbi:hypothetical protein LguiB_023057 [Lonicera macranthoides]
MPRGPQNWLLSLLILLVVITAQKSLARLNDKNGLKSAVFLSPKFVMETGSVSNKFYYNIDLPRGHIAIKSFNAEVVDVAGNPVPLHETYLHHWAVVRYYQFEGIEVSKYKGDFGFYQSNFIVVKNAGICGNGLPQFFGLGSETRRTATHVPDPYGIEVGNLAEIPSGYEGRWLLNVHAIDTRGAEDSLGCTECRCDLYNVTKDEYGQPLNQDYVGGLRCCYDETRCRIEYNIESCVAGVASDSCVDSRRVSLSMLTGGDVIYGAAHQHTGGIGSALYGEDGRVICSSLPIYGDGKEAGNEAGYIVGMSACYPQPGTVKISNGETLILESNYSSTQGHTGVMGLFYLLVADPPTKPNSFLHTPGQVKTMKPHFVWGEVFFGVSIAAAIIAGYRRRSQREDGYESIVV